MFAGLVSPSHLIIVLVLVLLLFGAKRIPELAKDLRTGIKELRVGISTSAAAEAEAPEPRRFVAKPVLPCREKRRSARPPAREASKRRVRYRCAGDGTRRATLLGHLRSQQAPRDGPGSWAVCQRSPSLGGGVQGGSCLRRGRWPGASQEGSGSGRESGPRGDRSARKEGSDRQERGRHRGTLEQRQHNNRIRCLGQDPAGA